MRVYTAAFYQTASRARSVHQRITAANYVYPWMLESFHYMDHVMLDNIRWHRRSVFLDSGAFSAFTQRISINIDKYARFLKQCREVWHTASNLDVIGAGHEQENYENLKKLEGVVGKGVVCPVHHVRDQDKWLRRYLDEGYDYIFLGGMVPERAPDLQRWLDHVWTKYLCNKDGSPMVKVHGFGLTNHELMFRYPWYSVDSTSWEKTSSFGACFLDFPGLNGEVARIKVFFSERSSKRHDPNSWHFQTLAPRQQDVVRNRLNELEITRRWKADEQTQLDFRIETGVDLAYTPEALAKSYGLRRVLNMDFFQRVADQSGIGKMTRL